MAFELLQDFFFTLYAHLRRAFEHDLIPRRGTGCLCLPQMAQKTDDVGGGMGLTWRSRLCREASAQRYTRLVRP